MLASHKASVCNGNVFRVLRPDDRSTSTVAWWIDSSSENINQRTATFRTRCSCLHAGKRGVTSGAKWKLSHFACSDRMQKQYIFLRTQNLTNMRTQGFSQVKHLNRCAVPLQPCTQGTPTVVLQWARLQRRVAMEHTRQKFLVGETVQHSVEV